MIRITVILLVLLLYGCSENMTTETHDLNNQNFVTIYFSDKHIEGRSTEVNMPLGYTVRIFALKRTGSSAAPTTDIIVAEQCYEMTSTGMIPCNVDNNGVVTDHATGPMKLRTGTYDFYLISPAKPLDNTRTVTVYNGSDFIANIAPVTTTINPTTTQSVTISGLKHLCHNLNFIISRSPGATYALDIGDGITVKDQPATASYTLGNTQLSVNTDYADYNIGSDHFVLTNNVIAGGIVLLPRSTTGVTILASLKINTLLKTFTPTAISNITMKAMERSTANLTVQYTDSNNDPSLNLVLNTITILPWDSRSPEDLHPNN